MCENGNPPEEFLTEKELEARIKVKRKFLSRKRRAKRNPLPHLKLGDGPKPRILYEWSKVRSWLEGNGSPRRGRPRNVDRDGGQR